MLGVFQPWEEEGFVWRTCWKSPLMSPLRTLRLVRRRRRDWSRGMFCDWDLENKITVIIIMIIIITTLNWSKAGRLLGEMRCHYFPCVLAHWPGPWGSLGREICVDTYLVLLGGVGACFPGFPPPAAPLLSWTTVDLLDRMAEAGGAGPDPGSDAPRGEGRESSRGGRTFLLGNMGVWLELLEGGRNSASTSSVMEDSCKIKYCYYWVGGQQDDAADKFWRIMSKS